MRFYLRRILALSRTANNFRCEVLRGSDRQEYKDRLWDLYKITYSAIGMHLTGPSELMDYDIWDLCIDEDSQVRQFNLFKTTQWGLKSGLVGHDGSPEAKRWAVGQLKKRFSTPGFYGEVSHKIKDIAVSYNVAAVCSSYVSQVLGKQVQQEGPLEYTRSLGVLGNVTKIMVGKPKGIPTTSSQNPSCPMEGPSFTASSVVEGYDLVDRDAHLSCLLDME